MEARHALVCDKCLPEAVAQINRANRLTRSFVIDNSKEIPVTAKTRFVSFVLLVWIISQIVVIGAWIWSMGLIVNMAINPQRVSNCDVYFDCSCWSTQLVGANLATVLLLHSHPLDGVAILTSRPVSGLKRYRVCNV